MTVETITCKCGVTFEWDPDSCRFFSDSDPYKWRPDYCDECANRIEAEQEEEYNRRRIAEIANRSRMSVIEETPPIFRATDTDHPKFNVKGWRKVMDWRPSAEKPWLGLVGETGTCKSRIAYMLAAGEIERMTNALGYPSSFQFVTAYKISDLVGRLASSSFDDKDEARADLARLRDTNLLLIDDLGKGRTSPSVAAEMFALIDHRYCHALPTLWTANSLPDVFAKAMPVDCAAPFAGRLNDSSRIILFR